MKRRILLATALFCLLFVAGGICIAIGIARSVAPLDRVVQMHQVEILREQLLYRVKTVQAAIKAKQTRFYPGADVVISDVLKMGDAMRRCLDCHHSPSGQKWVAELRDDARILESNVSRMLTVRANEKRLAEEEDRAWRSATDLLEKTNDMITRTSGKLHRQTRAALEGIRQSHSILFPVLALGPLLAVAFALTAVRWLVHPVEELAQAARRWKSGNLDHRVQKLRYEFGELGEAFNEMALSLREQMDALHRAEQLAVCGTLAAGLAHEIKNPLAGIKISLQVLEEDLELSEEDELLLGKAQEEIDRIDGLMRNLLDFARPRPPEFGLVDLNRVIEEAMDLAERQARITAGDDKVLFVTHFLDDLPEVHADWKQLHQVFLNLLLNGIDAMPQGGTLTVTTSLNQEHVVAEVSDTGPGISPDTLDKIFEPFFTRKPKGTGLGLAISRRLVEQHGGAIFVSNLPSGGACFTVLLPINEAREKIAA